jgi:tripartite-type tricarboxylate transporter receptor subunit TctC
MMRSAMTMTKRAAAHAPALLALVSVLASSPVAAQNVAAQDVAAFYKGKQIDMYIGTPPGGGYDQYGRVLGRHMSRHIPGHPAIVYRNMPAGGGRQAMNHVYNVAPADGTAIGTTLRNIAFDPLFGEEATRIDAGKLSWIGSLNSEVSVCVAWHTSPFRTIADLRKGEILMGSSGPTSSDTIQARLINRIAGTRMRLVHGYKGSIEVHLAMERGEVQGRCGLGWDSIVARYQHWIDDKKVAVLAQFALRKHPDIPEVTSILDLAQKLEDKQLVDVMLAPLEMGRPFFAPPNVPAERVAALRRAFDATAKDPEFLADVKKQKMELSPLAGAEVATLVERIYQTPKAVIDIAKQIASGG